MPGTRQVVRTICEFDHESYWPLPVPDIGTKVFCQRCDDFAVVKEIPDYWYAKCSRRNCFEIIKLTENKAMSAGRTHAKSRRHLVTIYHQKVAVWYWDVDAAGWRERTQIIKRH